MRPGPGESRVPIGSQWLLREGKSDPKTLMEESRSRDSCLRSSLAPCFRVWAGSSLPRNKMLDSMLRSYVYSNFCLTFLANFLANFERPVLGLIDADFCT